MVHDSVHAPFFKGIIERREVFSLEKYRLLTAEKPSVAKDLADVVGANIKKNGYYEGNGYRVTWAVGHLVGLEEPEAYGFMKQEEIYEEGNREKAWEELPIIPEKFKLKVLEKTAGQFEIVRELMLSDETEEIIDCGDMGPEGHILQWFIREKVGCRKPVRRFCATSMTREAITSAMQNLMPIDNYKNIIKGEYCKKKADWITGMSLSRAGSLKYNTNFSVGRVQSPTLYFIVKRYLDVSNFKQKDFFTMKADFDGFSVFWKKDSDNIFDSTAKDDDNRVTDKLAIDKKCQAIKESQYGVITELKTEKKATNRPQLYDITELERDANRKYGYTAAGTLATAQALYETQKILSYPRTDSRYITSDLVPYMDDRIKAIATLNKYSSSCEQVLSDGLNIDKKIVDDSKVTDHHALICTENIKNYDLNKLVPTDEEKKKGVTPEMMRNILDLVLTRMIVAFSQPYLYIQTSVEVTFQGGIRFTASGTRPVKEGWKGVEKVLTGDPEDMGDEQNDEQLFPNLEEGMKLKLRSCSVITKKTTPPKLHTEATLLTAMENAGASVEGGEILKGRGIGTQATRAEIIKVLFEKQYCETLKKGKINYIVPTQKGLKIIRALPKELTSPKMTADWENKIALIAEGKADENEFMDEFIPFIKEKTSEIRNSTLDIDFRNAKEPIGKCPFCGKNVFKGKSKKTGAILFYCSHKFDEDDPCGFMFSLDSAVFISRLGKNLSEKDAIKLINEGSITKTCKKQTGEGTYTGIFSFVQTDKDGKPGTSFKVDFANRKKPVKRFGF